MKKKYVFVFLFSLFLAVGFSQVSGIVYDNNNVPIPGVSVIIKGTSKGTITDFDGKYTIEAANGDTLVFSYVGYDTKEIVVTGSKLNVVMQSGVALDEVVLVGSRNANRTATNTPVPVDVIDISELITSGPQVNLNQILNYVAPSFTSNTQTISDGTDHLDPASLRGLGPDQVLVLINGKRRHNSALVNINGTFGRGSVGTDLNSIPSVAIRRIEVLRDGAAAQYGSDAIAGVINIVLKEETDKLYLGVTTGANFSRNANEQTGGVDGETTNVAASYGISLGDKGGYINFAGDFDYRDQYNRMKEWEGSVFNAYNAIERVASNSGYDISNLLDSDISDIKRFAPNVNHFSTDFQAQIQAAADKDALQDILNADVTEAELSARNQNRADYNMRIGQSEVRGGRLFANFELPVDDSGTQIYAFAGISSRKGNSAGFYRLPNQPRTYTPIYINGFLPEINTKIKDKSFAAGIKGDVKGWDVDFSNTWGVNSFLYEISNTLNASMEKGSPLRFDAGGFSFTQNTTNLDVVKFYDDVASGLNVAFGGEYRFEQYDIVAGEIASYSQYDITGLPIRTESQVPPADFFGSARPGGSQVFPGFSEANEVSRDRSSIATYLDLELDATDAFLINGALRFENYSDFGSTLNWKLASRYKLTDNFNIRGALSTGFRAPSLHQINFNSTSTIFVDGVPQEVGTFSNDSRAAKLLGIPQLKEEESFSASLGFTGSIPSLNMKVTVDGYFIAIDDRVVYTGQFQPSPDTDASGNVIRDTNGNPVYSGNQLVLFNTLNSANATAAAFFANAIDTESYGIDVVITQQSNLTDNLLLKNDLSATFSKTQQVGDIKASELLRNADLVDTYFDETSRIFLEEGIPRTKINLSQTLTYKKFNVFFRNVYFGEVTEATNSPANNQIYNGKIVSDLSVGYNVNNIWRFTVGANNLFDIYPDRTIEANRSSGRFDWSRRSQQFGYGGRFLFARVTLDLGL